MSLWDTCVSSWVGRMVASRVLRRDPTTGAVNTQRLMCFGDGRSLSNVWRCFYILYASVIALLVPTLLWVITMDMRSVPVVDWCWSSVTCRSVILLQTTALGATAGVVLTILLAGLPYLSPAVVLRIDVRTTWQNCSSRLLTWILASRLTTWLLSKRTASNGCVSGRASAAPTSDVWTEFLHGVEQHEPPTATSCSSTEGPSSSSSDLSEKPSSKSTLSDGCRSSGEYVLDGTTTSTATSSCRSRCASASMSDTSGSPERSNA